MGTLPEGLRKNRARALTGLRKNVGTHKTLGVRNVWSGRILDICKLGKRQSK